MLFFAVIPVYGHGQANITMTNVEIKMKLLTKEVEKDGKLYVQIEKGKFDFDTNRYVFKLFGPPHPTLA